VFLCVLKAARRAAKLVAHSSSTARRNGLNYKQLRAQQSFSHAAAVPHAAAKG
jgi:hypothetical protein